MGIRRDKDRKRAIELRLEGKSYNEICKILDIRSKGTISYWLKGLELTTEAKKSLAKNIQLAHERGFSRFNIERSSRIKDENEAELERGRGVVGKLTHRELLLLGAALYWGEGTKAVVRQNFSLSFANSDPQMVRAYLRFIREVLCISEEKIRAGMHIYENTSDEQGRKYWAKITGLPPDRFYIVRVVSKASQGKRSANLLPYGTAVIRVNNRRVFHYVLGLIRGLAGDINIKTASELIL